MTAARAQLTPLLNGVINALATEGDTGSFFAAGAFVQDLQDRLRVLESKAELLRLILDISLIGFQRFELSDPVRQTIDLLKLECETVTQALPASNDQR